MYPVRVASHIIYRKYSFSHLATRTQFQSYGLTLSGRTTSGGDSKKLTTDTESAEIIQPDPQAEAIHHEIEMIRPEYSYFYCACSTYINKRLSNTSALLRQSSTTTTSSFRTCSSCLHTTSTTSTLNHNNSNEDDIQWRKLNFSFPSMLVASPERYKPFLQLIRVDQPIGEKYIQYILILYPIDNIYITISLSIT